MFAKFLTFTDTFVKLLDSALKEICLYTYYVVFNSHCSGVRGNNEVGASRPYEPTAVPSETSLACSSQHDSTRLFEQYGRLHCTIFCRQANLAFVKCVNS